MELNVARIRWFDNGADMKNFRVFFSILAVLGLGMVIALVYRPARSGSPHEFTSIEVNRNTIEVTVAAMGRLKPFRGTDVGTQVSGQLKKLHVAIGDDVEAGQLVAEIDPTAFQSRVDADSALMAALQAQLDEKKVALELAEAEFRRKLLLQEKGSISESVLEARHAALKSARAAVRESMAQVEQGKANLEFDTINLERTKIYAPISGTVVSQTAFEGQALSAVQEAPVIIGIADLNRMTVEAYVAEADIGSLVIGHAAYFTVLGQPEQNRAATVRQINPMPEVINNVVLYKVLIDVPNVDRSLMIGMTAQVFFLLARSENAIVVPVTALEISSNKSTHSDDYQRRNKVFVHSGDGSVEPRQVVVGIKNRVDVEILHGLSVGERVIVARR